MEKHKKREKSSKQVLGGISRSEYKLIDVLKSNRLSVFDVSILAKLLNWKMSKIYQAIHSLKTKGFIKEIKRGMYVLAFEKEPDILPVSCKIIWPSYISFWTALSYYHFTEQLPRTIFLVTTKKSEKIKFNNNKILFVKLSAKRFFGYRKIDKIVIAEKEKSLTDSLLFPRYAGGVSEVFKCLCNAWNEIDKNTLIKHALRMNNKSLLKRLGYLIEAGELKIETKLLRKLNLKIGKGYSKLDPQSNERGDYSRKWGLIINIKKGKLFEWKVIA